MHIKIETFIDALKNCFEGCLVYLIVVERITQVGLI